MAWYGVDSKIPPSPFKLIHPTLTPLRRVLLHLLPPAIQHRLMNALLGVFVPKRSTSSSLKDCLIVFVDRPSAVGVHLQPHVADRDKDEIVLAVRCNRVGGLTRRWRIGIDLTNNQCGHQIVVIRIEDGYADALKSSEVHALLSGVEP